MTGTSNTDDTTLGCEVSLLISNIQIVMITDKRPLIIDHSLCPITDGSVTV